MDAFNNTREHTPEQKFALEYLKIAADTYQRGHEDRGYWALLARRHGLHWQEIGDALGMSMDGARMLAKRSAKRPEAA